MEDKPQKKTNLPAKRGFYGNLKYGRGMLRDYRQKKYPHFPWKSTLAFAVAILYMLFPVDIIPDFIVGFGLIDDAVISAIALKAIDMDIAEYRKWLEKNDET